MDSPEPWVRAELELPLGRDALRVALTARAPVVGVVGPSGSGKSTLLRVLAGVETRARGRLTCFGERWLDGAVARPPWTRRVGWVPQDALLFPHLDVRHNLAYAGAAPAAVEATAEALGVEALLDRAPRHLSGGERQRVAIGRALLASPRLLLLDEPFAALDRPLRARVAAHVAAWVKERGGRLVLVTHDERDLAALDAAVWEVRDGGLVPGDG